ncbi:MAG: helix-turn-helix domain-containing protein [Saccharofermentanales bacterium]|jgi:DNA-binding Xre family transcriptional regulator|nr:helix-turn-helix transcriptional regulator [Bacillota bacterium]
MAWSYEKLWKRIAEHGINKSKLRDEAGFRPATLSRLSHDEPVNMAILARICEYLNCNIGDIIDYISDKTETEIERKDGNA